MNLTIANGIAAKQQIALALPLRTLMIGVSFDPETFNQYLAAITAFQKEGFYNGQQGKWVLEQLYESHRIISEEIKQVEGKNTTLSTTLHKHLTIIEQVGKAVRG